MDRYNYLVKLINKYLKIKMVSKNFKKFRFKWVLYCSLASILGLFTLYFWPIISGFSVIIIQTVLLKTYLRNKAYLWLLKPLFIIFSILLYEIDELLGVVGTIVALELTFYITITRFSYFLWSLASGTPVLIFFALLETNYTSFDGAILILKLILLPCLTWLGQSFVLSKFLVLDENNISKYNPQILDAT